MSAYMSPCQIAARAEEVRAEFERLLTCPRIVRRPASKQWAFLRHCFEALLDGAGAEFACGKVHAVQYRYEVDNTLRRYYLTPGRPIRFLFRFMHLSTALSLRLVDESYPHPNGFVLLVTEDAREAPRPEDEEVRDLLERVVSDATDAEWRVYQRLPEIDLGPLEGCFVVGGPAYRRIQFLATQHNKRRLAIAEPPHNPSTKRVLDVRVIAVGREEAEVRTKEYWYLRWYALDERKYAGIEWRENNAQKYLLVRREGRWLVENNFYPPPRGSTPHRKDFVVG